MIEREIIEGDAQQVLATMVSNSTACIVTSPPYFWQRDYGVDGQIGHETTIEGYVARLVAVFREARRVLENEGTLFLNLGDTYYSAKGRPHGADLKQKHRAWSRATLRAVDAPGLGLPRKSLIGIPWRVAIAMQEDGWTLRSAITWRRQSLPEPSAKDRPWRTTETVFLFSKGPKYYFDRASLGGEEDVWTIPARVDNEHNHAAPFPDALAERCIRSGCRANGTVLDPFAGSGTTLRVAQRLGLRSIGIELSPQYCETLRQSGRPNPARNEASDETTKNT